MQRKRITKIYQHKSNIHYTEDMMMIYKLVAEHIFNSGFGGLEKKL